MPSAMVVLQSEFQLFCLTSLAYSKRHLSTSAEAGEREHIAIHSTWVCPVLFSWEKSLDLHFGIDMYCIVY